MLARSSSSLFYDVASGFALDTAGFGVSTADVTRRHALSLQECLRQITRIERGEIVNATAVASESENRAVDHYNLRMREELVPGKSLAASLAQWDEVKAAVDQIANGTVTNEQGEWYSDAVFNGIGGSYLGPLMLVVGILGLDFNLKDTGLPVRLHFVSNTDPEGFADVMSKLRLERTILVNMSKSGSTAETQGNMLAFNALLEERSKEIGVALEVGKHNMAITTPGSPFDKYAQQNGFMNVFHMNNETGGRTSVGSAIGMVPCAFAGLDFGEFLRGQCHMDEMTRRAEPLDNPAFIVASLIQDLTNRVGHRNMIVLGYHDHLREFAHYLQQLYMESLGKEYTTHGLLRPYGQTLFGGVGTGEQHAFMQQVQKGLRDCFVRFVHFRKRSVDFANPKAGSLGRQLLAFVRGTQNALATNGVPHMSITCERCDLFNWGMLVALEERIVSMLAVMNDINAYDQPGVQDGKLAADAMNDLSKRVEDAIASKAQRFRGTVPEFAAAFFEGQTVSAMNLEAILNDIEANYTLPGAYPKLAGTVRVSRTFDAQHREFVFELTPA